MSKWQDSPSEIRKGEELNTTELNTFLDGYFGSNESVEIKQFPSGFSNLTYYIKHGSKEMVLRRAPFGANIKSGHDMAREYRILSSLYKNYNKVPKPILYDDSLKVMETPFYLMEKVNGVILRAKMPNEMIPTSKTMNGIALSLVKTLTELHRLEVAELELSDFGKPEGYIDRQIKGWTNRYLAAKTEEIPTLEATALWLEKNKPNDDNLVSVIHNDYKYDNLVLDPQDWTRVRAILDWEMATIGHPLMDLGTTLGYWINHNDPDFMKAINLNPTTLPGNLTRAELVTAYEKESQTTVHNIEFYYAFGLFKIAVIVQQIYSRYKKGLTQDTRFSELNKVVGLLGKVTQLVISKRRIDDLL